MTVVWIFLVNFGQASFYGQVGCSKWLTIKYRFQYVNFSPSGFIASEFQWYNIDDLYNLTFHLHQLFSSRQEPTFVMASQLTLFGDSTVNTRSIRRVFGFFFTCRVRCHVHMLPKRHCDFGGVVNFIIKRILAIKRIFPCGFGNKRMRLLTHVYGIVVGYIWLAELNV